MNDLVDPEFNIEEEGFKFMGRGPEPGWYRSNQIYYRCAKCGTFMNSTNSDYFECGCGAMCVDADAFRFGSRYGDNNILVYEKIKHNNGG